MPATFADSPAAPALLVAPDEETASAAGALPHDAVATASSAALPCSSDESAVDTPTVLASATAPDTSSPRPLTIYDLPPPTPEEAAAEAAGAAYSSALGGARGARRERGGPL